MSEDEQAAASANQAGCGVLSEMLITIVNQADLPPQDKMEVLAFVVGGAISTYIDDDPASVEIVMNTFMIKVARSFDFYRNLGADGKIKHDS